MRLVVIASSLRKGSSMERAKLGPRRKYAVRNVTGKRIFSVTPHPIRMKSRSSKSRKKQNENQFAKNSYPGLCMVIPSLDLKSRNSFFAESSIPAVAITTKNHWRTVLLILSKTEGKFVIRKGLIRS